MSLTKGISSGTKGNQPAVVFVSLMSRNQRFETLYTLLSYFEQIEKYTFLSDKVQEKIVSRKRKELQFP